MRHSLCSHRRLGLRLEDELVVVKVENLLRDGEVGQGDDLAEEQDLALSQLEHEAGLQTSGQQEVTDQGPGLHWDSLLLTLKREKNITTVIKQFIIFFSHPLRNT